MYESDLERSEFVFFFSLQKLQEIVSFSLKLIEELDIVEDRIMCGFLPFLILVNQL